LRFRFNERKAAQAAAFLLSRHGGQLNYMALIKLLYLADRAALIERGLPITGDRMVSMQHGTVLSGILNRINTGPEDSKRFAWFDYVSPPTDYTVRLMAEPEVDELSEYELGLLTKIDEQFGHLSQWQLRDYTHTLPEWEDPHGSSLQIEPADILRLEAFSPDDVRRIHEEAEAGWLIGRIASGRNWK